MRALAVAKSVGDNQVLRPFILFLISIVLLITTVVAFKEIAFFPLVAIYLAIFLFPFLYRNFSSPTILANFQLFYIVPLLLSATLGVKYWRAEYLLQFLVLISGSFLCASEISKYKEHLKASRTSICLFGGVLISTWLLSEMVQHYPDISKFITLVAVFILYMMLDAPSERLAAFKAKVLYKKAKRIIFALAIISVYGVISITGKANFTLYIIYAVSVINLCFSFREDKISVLAIAFILVLASFMPFGPKETHIDSLIITCIVMLFHLHSPVLYYKSTQYGEVKVEYSYRFNKIYLVHDGIIQGERLLDQDSNTSARLRYFGGKNTNSIISSIFNLVDEDKHHNIAVLGLGTGALAMFGKEKQLMHFYEINPEVVKIAYNRKFFDYITTSLARIKVTLGDAREKINEVKSAFYSLICVDVYLGSSMPNHFFTFEAVEMYLDKLDRDGVLAFHASGDNVEGFEHKISDIARKLNLIGIVAYEQYTETGHMKKNNGLVLIPERHDIGHKVLKFLEIITNASLIPVHKEEVYVWIVLTKNKNHIKKLEQDKRWYKLASKVGDDLYTDEMIRYKRHQGRITQEVD